MHEKLQHCPLCNSGQLRLTQNCKDHSVSHETFGIDQCQTCQLLFTNPRPAEEEAGKYYESANYISHTNEGNSLVNRVYKLVRQYTLQQKIKLLQQHPPVASLLDVGCGTGHFLGAAKKKGWRVDGVEVSPAARGIAEEALQQKLYSELAQVPLETKYEAITLWHVLEHVYDLNGTVAKLKQHLHKNGHLYIAVPNPESYDAKHYGSAWAAWDVPRHLYHFSEKVMQRLASQHALELLSAKPMYFDAFYVSMLSEQYKTGKQNYVKAVQTGLKSNLRASKNQQQYSSLIYILKHA